MKSSQNAVLLLSSKGVRLLLMLVLLLVANHGSVAQTSGTGGQPKKLPFGISMEYALRLPSYCHGQYFGRAEPQYQLPPRELCGIGTNHFCPGLASLDEARDTQDRGRKSRLYTMAAKRFRYTLRHIEKYPNCPLRPEVESVLLQTEMEMKLFR